MVYYKELRLETFMRNDFIIPVLLLNNIYEYTMKSLILAQDER